MSSKSDFEAHEASIRAIDDQAVKQPNMPVGVYLQEAEDLAVWVEEDLPRLTAAGLDPALVEELASRTGALRWIQSQWTSTRLSKEEARKQYAAHAPEAYDLRARLVHHMLFAFRKHPDLLGSVRAVVEGTGDADMIQDLNDLAVLGRNNPEPLAAINFDVALLDEAANKSSSLASLLGAARGGASTGRQVKILRDKAYTFLKQAVDEIREHGQYVFWREEERRIGYSSAHFRRTRGKNSPPHADSDSSDAQ